MGRAPVSERLNHNIHLSNEEQNAFANASCQRVSTIEQQLAGYSEAGYRGPGGKTEYFASGGGGVPMECPGGGLETLANDVLTSRILPPLAEMTSNQGATDPTAVAGVAGMSGVTVKPGESEDGRDRVSLAIAGFRSLKSALWTKN